MFGFWISLSFILLISTISSEFAFSDSQAREYWFYQMMSECKSERIQAWDVEPIHSLYPKTTDIQVFYNSTGSNIGYVAFNPSSNVVFMVFGGTHNFENWLQDFDVFKVDYPKCPSCEVHQGFFGAYHNLKDNIVDAFVALAQKYQSSRKVIIGHSLGAAMATLAFLDLVEVLQIDEFYTFGSPRVGNDKFADFFNKISQNSLTARITHYEDFVPRLPFNFIGFKHVDREVFYNEDSSVFAICRSGMEDDQCSMSFQIYEIGINDHTTYMGFDLKPVKHSCI